MVVFKLILFVVFIIIIFLLFLRNEKYILFLWLFMDIVKIKYWFLMMFYCFGIMWIIFVVILGVVV